MVVKLERDVPGLNKDAFKESIKNSGGTPTSLARVGDAAYTYPANMEAVNPFTS